MTPKVPAMKATWQVQGWEIQRGNLLVVFQQMDTLSNAVSDWVDLCCFQHWPEKPLFAVKSGLSQRLMTGQSVKNKWLYVFIVNGSPRPTSFYPRLRKHHRRVGGKIMNAREWRSTAVKLNLWGRYTHELIAAVIVNTRPVIDQAHQQFSKNGWGAHKVPPVSKELLAIDVCL